MKNDEQQGLSRRDFLKRLGATTASAALMMGLEPLSALAKDDDVKAAVASGMTYRLNRKTGDKVSLLGYGMMRLPQKDGQIDQELVNREVRYALEHGVNYFDTSPHYVGGRSEASLGKALKASTFPNVLTSLSGMTLMEHLEDNLATHSPLDPCTSDELALLEEIAKNVAAYPLIPCTDCRYCMPCPYGVNIPGNFAAYNRAVNEGSLPPADHAAPDFAQKSAAFIAAYRGSLTDKQLASACTGCRECLKKCPQRIQIPGQMARLTDLLEVAE